MRCCWRRSGEEEEEDERKSCRWIDGARWILKGEIIAVEPATVPNVAPVIKRP